MHLKFNYENILTVDIILRAIVFKKFFLYTAPIYKYLQTVSLYFFIAYQILKGLYERLSKMTKDSVSILNSIYEEVFTFVTFANANLCECNEEFNFIVDKTFPQKHE